MDAEREREELTDVTNHHDMYQCLICFYIITGAGVLLGKEEIHNAASGGRTFLHDGEFPVACTDY